MRYAFSHCTYEEKFENGVHTYVFTGPCFKTGKPYSVIVPAAGLFQYNQGAKIQDAFPHMSNEDREFLMSGYSPEGWNLIFGNKETPMVQAETTIINKLGLHARASGVLTQTVTPFKSDVWITRNGRRVNAKSIMGVMMLAAGIGSTVTIEADGEDEQTALDAVLA